MKINHTVNKLIEKMIQKGSYLENHNFSKINEDELNELFMKQYLIILEPGKYVVNFHDFKAYSLKREDIHAKINYLYLYFKLTQKPIILLNIIELQINHGLLEESFKTLLLLRECNYKSIFYNCLLQLQYYYDLPKEFQEKLQTKKPANNLDTRVAELYENYDSINEAEQKANEIIASSRTLSPHEYASIKAMMGFVTYRVISEKVRILESYYSKQEVEELINNLYQSKRLNLSNSYLNIILDYYLDYLNNYGFVEIKQLERISFLKFGIPQNKDLLKK